MPVNQSPQPTITVKTADGKTDKMTLAELLPALHGLPRADKLRVIQLLATDVAREEGVEVAAADKPYPIWSPYDAFGSAATLLRVLDEERGT